MSSPDIQIFPSDPALAEHAVALILSAASEAVAARGRFTIALTGGSSPVKAYERLAHLPTGYVDWAKWIVFLGDERFVPADDPRSNYGQARRTLLAHVPISPGQIFPILTDTATPEEAAVQYAETVANIFQQSSDGPPPAFDMILLGLGDDGHTASLFPNYSSLSVTDRWVIASPPGTLPPPVDRVTFTFPLINAARQVVFLVSGEKKAVPVRDILEGGAQPEQRPAAAVKPTTGTLTWLLDKAAAALLTGK